jgi:sugar lactone lactonase YvrE
MTSLKTISALIVATASLFAQSNAPNSQPNPYREVDHWAQLPAGADFGQVISVNVDRHGNIWAFQRINPPIMEFDPSGKLLKSFGDGMFIQAHGMDIDREGNIWVTDAGNRNGKGEQVFKFSPDGKVLMTLGKAGVPGEGPDTFNGPADVAIAPNGDIFIADGHNNTRVVKFSKDGTFIKAWGQKGSAPGEFKVVHSLAFDSKGRLFVADRGNQRIQIFDQDGKFLAEWKQFGSPSGIYIDKNDVMYVADSDSNTKNNPGWKRGIRVGSAKDGKVTAFIPDPQPDPDSDAPDPRSRLKISVTSAAEGVAADSEGNIYGAEVGPAMLRKYVRAAMRTQFSGNE